MEPQPEHVLIARFPQTSQSGSAFGGGRAEAADEPTAAADELPPSTTPTNPPAAGEGGVGAGDGTAEDGPFAALDGFRPFFFVIVG